MSAAIACGEACAPVSWELLQEQAIFGAAGVGGLAGVGLLVSLGAPKTIANLRGYCWRLEYGLASLTSGSSLALIASHLAQCIIWGARAATSKVDPVYHAVEMLFSIFVWLDVIAAWFFVVTRGFRAVIAATINGRFVLDCLVASSVVALAARDESGDRTWFSYSFLAGVRLLRILEFVQRGDAYSSHSSAWRQASYHCLMVVLFVFVSAAAMMVLERLGTPTPAQEAPWDLAAGAVFTFSTMFTVGDDSFTPRSILGRAFAVCLICWAVLHLVTGILPLMVSQLLGRGLGNGSYRPRVYRSAGHVVVLGTPTAPMLWDFLLEIYHQNHFNGIADLDRTAPEVVIMLPCERTFAHFRRYMGRQESLLFRDRVTFLLGDVFSPEDRKRVNLWKAKRVIILPNLTSADVAADDHANSMRMFAITGSAPRVRALCLLHRAGNIPADRGCGSFLSMDAFKLSLLAMACLTPGSLTFVSNLCKTIGNSTLRGLRPWQQDYENGLGGELYEVPLSTAYHQATFSQAYEDTLARSKQNDVYLVGLVERMYDAEGGKWVRIHPGAETLLNCVSRSTAGVFVAPDVGAVLQCPPGEELMAFQRDKKTSVVEAKGTAKLRKTVTMAEGAPAVGAGLPNSPEEEFSMAQQERAARHLKWEHKLAENGYQQSMAVVQQRLLVQGFGVKVVSEVANKLQEGAKMKGWDAGVGTVLAKSPTQNLDSQRIQSAERLAALTAAVGVPPAEEKLDGATQRRLSPQDQAIELKSRKIGRLHSVYDRGEGKAPLLPPPPLALLDNGGHLLLCVVDDAASGTEGGMSTRPGPEIGLANFMGPLRDTRVQTSDMRPLVVVLAETVPGDWYAVAEDGGIFFVQGSPLCLEDLDAAGFRKARAIAIIRGRKVERYSRTTTKVADSRVVLAASLIEKNLPNDSSTPVITDHAYQGSCNFLPVKTAAAIEAVPSQQATNVGGVPDLSGLLENVAGMIGLAPGGAVAALTSVPRPLEGGLEEDYESLEYTDYLHHPRFMKGQVFVSSVVTGLAACTVYNPSLVILVKELLEAPMLLLPVPRAWERKSYAEFSAWLLRERNLLAAGIYRSSTAADVGAFGRIDLSAPTHFYTYSAPPGKKTLMIRSDRVLCLIPCS